MSRTWFTSDTHYHHRNICSATSEWGDKTNTRQFASLEQMNDVLVANINAFIGQDDVLYHLGDWSFGGREKIGQLRERLGVKTVHLIRGNHDHHLADGSPELKHFTTVQDYKEVLINGQHIVLCHYAMRVWNESHKGSWMLYGHSHGTLPGHGLSMDVGVDTHNYFPYSFEQIRTIMSRRPQHYADHHGPQTSTNYATRKMLNAPGQTGFKG